jgi:hypothetical protein
MVKEHLDANLLKTAVELRDSLPRDPEAYDDTEEAVVIAMRQKGMKPLEILGKMRRYAAAVGLVRLLRPTVDRQV